jgi:S-methylmethionine-dependent homocysteine/selenocysteine methylase
MATLTEIFAAVAVHSSAAALSHLGVTLAPAQVVRPAQPAASAERVVARSPRAAAKLVNCAKPGARTLVVHA